MKHKPLLLFLKQYTNNSDFSFNRHPGYVLQQCAINNNVTHFTKIIENPNCGLEDLTYSKHDATESNPIMIAAKLRHKDLVSSILRSNKFENSDEELLGQLIHSKNKTQDPISVTAKKNIILANRLDLDAKLEN